MAGIAQAPLPAQDRILYLDVLRGAALFGVLAINMQQFAGTERSNGVAEAFIAALIESKFIVLFSFLFGVGFAVQVSRARARGVGFLSFYPRRLLALALFGLIHGIVIWTGDILLCYAISGALLLLFRNQSQRAVLYWAGCFIGGTLVVSSAPYAAAAFGLRALNEGNAETAASALQHTSTSYAPRSFLRLIGDNWHTWLSSLGDLSMAIPLLSLFLLGLWVWRTGILERLDQNQPLLRRVCGVCLPLGLALEATTALVPILCPTTPFTLWFLNVPGLLFPPILSVGYATGLALLIQKGAWERRLMPFAAVGRMALTNYLAQSVICTAFFLRTELYGKLGPSSDLALAAGLYTVQVVVSNWWLGHFRYGPMEWLWRGMTYGSFPAMLRSGGRLTAPRNRYLSARR